MTVFTASDAVVSYIIEEDFNGSSTGNNQRFGRGETIETVELNNNNEQLYEFGDRLPGTIRATNVSGSFSVSFTLATFQFLELLEKDPASSGTGADQYDLGSRNSDPQSFKISITRDGSGEKRLIEGCVVQSLEMDSNVDGTVNVTLSGSYATEKVLSGVASPSDPSVSGNKPAQTFADTTLDFDPDDSNITIGLPQGVTVSVEQNNPLLSVLGQRQAGAFATAGMTASVDISEAVEEASTDSLETMYGVGGIQDVQDNIQEIETRITFDNGKPSGEGQVQAVFKLFGKPESYSESGLNSAEDFVSADLSYNVSTVIVNVTED